MSQILVAMLAYEDGRAAMDWLVRAFGFAEVARIVGEENALIHGELTLDGSQLLIASPKGYRCPRSLRAEHPERYDWLDQPWIFDGVLIRVADFEATLTRLREMNGEILSPPEDGYPGRRVRVADPEGHRWYVFAREPVKENTPQ